jgi:5-methylcytosine-specific restriction endonuclease McrA
MSLYNDSKWKIFRDSVIELDGYKCSYCGRGSNETILQVHHKKYISGCKPWEYATEDCETVCKGCHASIHGIIQPQFRRFSRYLRK